MNSDEGVGGPDPMPMLCLTRLFRRQVSRISSERAEQQATPRPVSSQQSGHAALPQFLQTQSHDSLDVGNSASISILQFESPDAFSAPLRETR